VGALLIDLGAWLKDNLARPRVAAEWDCCAYPAAWSLAQGTDDPMAAWRGAYDTDAGAEDILARSGGLAGIFGAGLESVGWEPHAGEPQPGDVGVIALLDQEAGAIYTGRRWSFVATRGLGFVSLERKAVSHIWRLPARG
jgi:hypothetical protein